MSKIMDLAWSLGCVEVLSFEPSKRKSQFTHLLVIDFESTCWKGDEPNKGKNEIIEFPAVLMETTSGQLLDEFRQFVMPIESPKLSNFCKNLTGITQQDVDDGVPLPTCLYLFKQWLDQMHTKHGISTLALVTWSNWDLNVCLKNECKRKSIVKPSIFSKWIDLRLLYGNHTRKEPRGLRAAVEDVGLYFIGREHSGIVDARNTAHLAWKLHLDGMAFAITKDLTATCGKYSYD